MLSLLFVYALDNGIVFRIFLAICLYLLFLSFSLHDLLTSKFMHWFGLIESLFQLMNTYLVFGLGMIAKV